MSLPSKTTDEPHASLRGELEITAELMNISISGEQEEKILQSFDKLLDYFTVMNSISTEQEPAQGAHDEKAAAGDDEIARGALRDAAPIPFENPAALIVRSEEHEDNYVLIPNVL